MATEALKTTAITNLDATPPVRTTDYGARGQYAFATISPTNGMQAGSTYQLMRLPFNAKIKSIKLWLDAGVTTFAGDVTLYYSDNAQDGTDSVAGTGAVAAHIYQTALDLHAVTSATEYYMGGNIKGAGLGKELWQDAGLAATPQGGFYDLVVLLTSTTSGSPVLNAQIEYVSR